jgi:hypothetical protein
MIQYQHALKQVQREGIADHGRAQNGPQTMDFFEQPLESDPVIEAYKKDVDRTLIRKNLRLSHEERVLNLMELQRFAEELRRAGRRAKDRA